MQHRQAFVSGVQRFCERFTRRIDIPARPCYGSIEPPVFPKTGQGRLHGKERQISMTKTYKRVSAALLSVLLVCVFTFGASAAASLNVGIKFWKEKTDKESMANTGIDADRDATLTRQSNGTYTLTLPIQQVSKMGITGYLTGLTIGDVTYTGTVSGDVAKGTGVLTIKNMPASVLTGSDVNKALTVTCNIQMDLSLLGEINTSARMCIWNK